MIQMNLCMHYLNRMNFLEVRIITKLYFDHIKKKLFSLEFPKFIGIFLIYQLESKQEPLQNNVEIQNIQLQPATIKIGNTFTVNATLVNNSQKPIRVVVPHCAFESSVTFYS